MALIFLRRILEMRVMKKNNLTLILDLISIIQESLVLLTMGEVPCLVGFSEGGGISGHIFTNIIKQLDALKLYANDR